MDFGVRYMWKQYSGFGNNVTLMGISCGNMGRRFGCRVSRVHDLDPRRNESQDPGAHRWPMIYLCIHFNLSPSWWHTELRGKTVQRTAIVLSKMNRSLCYTNTGLPSFMPTGRNSHDTSYRAILESSELFTPRIFKPSFDCVSQECCWGRALPCHDS